MSVIKEFKLSIKPLKQTPRKVWVYLPDSYQTSNKKYPVLYMFDGHNLFYDDVATYGKCWGLKEYLDKTKKQLIVVGVDCNHTDDRRLYEYCPYEIKDGRLGEFKEHYGDITAKWFVETLKPTIEKKFRVSTNRKDIGIAGSSMGGLMSVYMIAKYNKYFSKAACLSSSIDICFDELINEVNSSRIKADTKIYMDFGGSETKSRAQLATRINKMLTLSHQFNIKGAQVYPRVVTRGTHSEASWEKALPYFINYLF